MSDEPREECESWNPCGDEGSGMTMEETEIAHESQDEASGNQHSFVISPDEVIKTTLSSDKVHTTEDYRITEEHFNVNQIPKKGNANGAWHVEDVARAQIEISFNPKSASAMQALIQPIPAAIKSINSDDNVDSSRVEVGNDHKETKQPDIEQMETTEKSSQELPESLSMHAETRRSEWSDDDEEAGGLPRNDSCSKKVSRAVRQIFSRTSEKVSDKESKYDTQSSEHKHRNQTAKKTSSHRRRLNPPKEMAISLYDEDDQKMAKSKSKTKPIPTTVRSYPSTGVRECRIDKKYSSKEYSLKYVRDGSQPSMEDRKFSDWRLAGNLSRQCMLDAPPSIGPCFKQTGPHGRPSGIQISLTQKSLRNIRGACAENIVRMNSGICISCTKSTVDAVTLSGDHREGLIDRRIDFDHAFASFKEKLCNFKHKIRKIF